MGRGVGGRDTVPGVDQGLQLGSGDAVLLKAVVLLEHFDPLDHHVVIAVRQVQAGEVAQVIHGLLQPEHAGARHALLQSDVLLRDGGADPREEHDHDQDG